MYKVVKKELTGKRPRWLVILLMCIRPSLIGNAQSLEQCCLVLRYIRFCAYSLFHTRKTDKVYVIEGENTLTLCNNRRKKCVTFEIYKV